jgi:type IV pilus assembly protein PilO
MANLIPDDPKQRNALFIGVIFLLLLYPFYAFYYKGKKAEVDAIQSHLETLQDHNRQAQLLAARGGGDLTKNMALYDRQVKKLEQLIPAEEEVPALVDDISQRAREVGVTLNKISPEPSEAGAFYTKESYQMAVIGDYHPVARFLTAIASLPRIVRPVDVDVQPFSRPQLYPDYESPVIVNFRIETYVLPEAGATPPADGGGGGA